MEDCQHMGHLYDPIHLYILLYVCMPPYVCTSPYIHMPLHTPHTCSPYTICSPYVMGTWRASKHPICLGGNQYICQASLCLSVCPFSSQFITVIPVAPHHCGLLLYWTGCLWMSAMLNTVVPVFVVFLSCLKLLLPWL